MRPRQLPGQIRPKVSTMPRPKTEASAYLDIYKLVTERKRLQQELESLEERRDRIQKRLEVLDSQVANLEVDVQQLRQVSSAVPQSATQPKPTSSDSFNTFFLEY